ncbi:unnamed protein product [Didymodactylos carnosus]|nr:unnamed protein product [Didymodactylos carnosus]CAF4002626.1 unnamed protein product [Didymodactylos carnosus]
MEYQALPNVEIENDPEEQALTPYIHDPSQDYPENSEKQSRWSHQQDLDDFFSRVYQYHQRHGYFCIVLSEILALVQFIFIVSFTVLVLQCIDYPVLFRSSPASRNMTRKIQFNDVILSPSQCLRHQHLLISLCVALAVIYWIYRFCRAVYNLLSFYNIRLFYSQALDIKPKDLSNMTWHEVQQRLSKAQLKHDLCVHKQILTELDIHNRLLRFKNYEVAMVNKGLLPPKIHIPFIGDAICFTNGFKFNLRLILFWGPYSPFDQRWHLRQEYKINSQRDALARQLSRFILLYGITNLLLSPFIFIWQVLNLFYGYTELVRREPGVLGSRRWSNYGRLYLRHFNELDHSLNQRLNRGYKPAIFYMNSFVNYSIIEVAK